MYDKDYAKIWIANYESGKDVFRTEYLEPYLKDVFKKLQDGAKILDVGCGWGTVIEFLKPTHIYHGIDPVEEFFPYIRKKFPNKNVILEKGELPDQVEFDDDLFYFAICSLVLHANPSLEKSIQVIFSKVRPGGQVIIIDFNNEAEKELRKIYDPVYEEDEKHIKGESVLPSGLKVITETYFHKENDYERAISKFGFFKRRNLGPLFVVYECVKKMKENIIISNSEKLDKIKKNMAAAGSANFHVLADFDRTFTKAFTDGQQVATVFAQIRNGNYLSTEYAAEAHRLFDIYHPIEIDQNIDKEEKNKKMHEWWHKHFDLLIKSGLDKIVMEEIIQKREFFFRDGALGLIDQLYQKNIPLVIMSAGLGDMIEGFLRLQNKLYENVHVIANFFKFGRNGEVIGVQDLIIHSMNKHEIIIKNFPAFKLIKNRKNVLLLGDGVDDVGMIEGFEYDNLIKIGFLNENVEENLPKFKENFDVVILGDGSMNFVNDLVKELFG